MWFIISKTKLINCYSVICASCSWVLEKVVTYSTWIHWIFIGQNRPKLSLLHNYLKIELMGSKLDSKELSSPTPFFHEATELLAYFQLIRTSFDTNLWNLKEDHVKCNSRHCVDCFLNKREIHEKLHTKIETDTTYLLMVIILCYSFDIRKDWPTTCVSRCIIKYKKAQTVKYTSTTVFGCLILCSVCVSNQQNIGSTVIL